MSRTQPRALPSLLLLALVLASGAVMLRVFSAVQDSAKAELGLSDMQLALVQGLAVSIPLALLSVPVGLAVDRTPRVRLLFATSAVWTVGSLWTAFTGSVETLFAARMLTGLGASIATTIAISIAADLSPPERRGRSLLLLTIGQYAGMALSFALGGQLLGLFEAEGLLDLSGWRSVHLALGLVSAAVTVAMVTLREPARREQQAINPPLRHVMKELWKRRRFLAPLFLGQVGVFMVDSTATIWAVPVLGRDLGLAPQDVAGWMGAVVFGAGVVGALVGGFAADLGHRKGGRGGVLIGAVIASVLALPAAAFPIAGSAGVFGFGLFVLLLGGSITGLVTATSIAVLLPNELRGLCIGSFIAFAGLIGFGVGPTLVAMTSSAMGGEAKLAEALALIGLLVSAMAAVGFVLARRWAPEPVR
jgi:MFS family permease